MKPASISEIKHELKNLEAHELLELCLRMAKYKKENKELLSYLLYDSMNEEAYIRNIQKEVEESFGEMNVSNLIWAKKSVRKILRLVNKYAKYSGKPTTTLELLIHFCRQLKESGIPFRRNTTLNNLYQAQLKKIDKLIDSLHEDLQYDYRRELDDL